MDGPEARSCSSPGRSGPRAGRKRRRQIPSTSFGPPHRRARLEIATSAPVHRLDDGRRCLGARPVRPPPGRRPRFDSTHGRGTRARRSVATIAPPMRTRPDDGHRHRRSSWKRPATVHTQLAAVHRRVLQQEDRRVGSRRASRRAGRSASVPSQPHGGASIFDPVPDGLSRPRSRGAGR